jgi:hypothetical protein
MKRMRSLVLGPALVAAVGIGGALAPNLFSAGAATTPSTTTGTTTTGTVKSNEDATHEAGESAAREAAENNGTATFGHGGASGSNEDATHEAGCLEGLEHAVDARETDPIVERLVHICGRDAAVLGVEQRDHRNPGRAVAVARLPEPVLRVLCPRLRHA